MKPSKKKYNSIMSDNKGAALIVCIIVLLFVSILATIILYLSGINYRMKRSDLNNKVTFYESEIPLETMQTNLIVPVSEALNNAYIECNSTYIYDSTSDYNREKVFYHSFRDKFIELLMEQYSGPGLGATPANGVDMVKNILSNLTGVPVDHIYIDSTGAYDGNTLGYINYLASVDITAASYGNPPTYFKNDTLVLGNHTLDTYVVVAMGDLSGMTDTQILEDLLQFRYEKNDGTPEDLKDRSFYFDDIGVVTVRDNYRSIVTTKVAIHYPSLDVRYATDPANAHVNEYTVYNVYQLISYYDWQKN